MSVTPKTSLYSRRSVIAAASGLAASALAGNRAAAQIEDGALPDAADLISPMAPEPVPPLIFTDEKGRKLSLADYKGHVLVVNLWATWCGPCVQELPDLNALAAKMRPFGGLVLPISLDTDGAKAVVPFYARHGLKNLPVLLDPDGFDLDMMNAVGVPLTIVIDPEGRQVMRLDGAANWDTSRMLTLLRALASPEASPAQATNL